MTGLRTIISLIFVAALFYVVMPIATAYQIDGNNGIPARNTGGLLTPPSGPSLPPDPSDPSDSPEPPDPSVSSSVNPLTGLPMDATQARRRPLAISIGNTTEALPMNGISQADMVYEVLVEGGLTRMLALFQDISTAGTIGSIRSARHYTAQIAESHDAIFVTAGGSYLGYEEIQARSITHIDEVAGNHSQMFQRNRNRIPGRTVDNYHSAITTGALATQWLPRFNVRLIHDPSYTNSLSFITDGTPPGGSNANDVNIRFSAGKRSAFKYSHEHGGYRMRQFNTDFSDANDNSLPVFTNLLILKTNVTPIPNDAAGLQDVVTTGYGFGYFVCGGRYAEIFWFRGDKTVPFVYALKDGSALNLGRGKTYVAIIPDNMDVSFS